VVKNISGLRRSVYYSFPDPTFYIGLPIDHPFRILRRYYSPHPDVFTSCIASVPEMKKSLPVIGYGKKSVYLLPVR
jgi:hypothetical protein